MKRGIYSANDWRGLGRKHGLDLNLSAEQTVVESQLLNILEAERERWKTDLIGRARTSQFRQQFLTLDLALGNRSVFSDNYSMSIISWVIKARAELINFNYKTWIEQNYLCSLCNLNENESVYHFIAKCPILKILRKKKGDKRKGKEEKKKKKRIMDYIG